MRSRYFVLYTKELTKLIDNFNSRKKELVEEFKCGIISRADMLGEMDMINSKTIKAKRALVAQVHVKGNGTPKSIRYEEARGLWVTKVNSEVRLHSKTEEGLLDKLLEYYDCYLMSYSIEHVFELAIENKQKTENCNKLTIQRYWDSFNRFIDDDFRAKDVRNITKDDIKAYTKATVKRTNPKKKAYYAFKGVLNLIFGYALEHDFIQSNPVLAINNRAYLTACDNSKPKNVDKILSKADILRIQSEIYSRMEQKRYDGYFVHGYMILLSIETGMRVAELCALKWDDIDEKSIHIHAQQLTERPKGGKNYIYAEWTKDEKGISQGGRYFPITTQIRLILNSLKNIQNGKMIKTKYVFCDINGNWIKIDAYTSCLRRLMKSLGYSITNNHAFRMSLNSNVFIPNNVSLTKRAELLGHSVETNLRHYSYAQIDAEDDTLSKLEGGCPSVVLKTS